MSSSDKEQSAPAGETAALDAGLHCHPDYDSDTDAYENDGYDAGEEPLTCGVVLRSHSTYDTMTFVTSGDPDVCPICYEERTDVAVLDHWEVEGDISDHKMCLECRMNYAHSQCPFCREILCKEDFLSFIHRFVNTFASNITGSDHSTMSVTFEQWQVLEMQLDGNIAILNRMAKHIIEDEIFASTLREAVFCQLENLREVSGIIFRFWGLLKDSDLKLRQQDEEILKEAIDCIISPLEGEHPPKLKGDIYATLYMQAIVPLLSARSSGCRIEILCDIAKRVGLAIVRGYNYCLRPRRLQAQVAEGMLTDYIAVSHDVVWGSREDDPVWNTFFLATGADPHTSIEGSAV